MVLTITNPPQTSRAMAEKYVQALYGQSLLEFARQLERELTLAPQGSAAHEVVG